jgi:alkylation response protein AidB-like acyl-CoA dehydrogenase
MQVELTEEQEFFRSSTRRFLETKTPLTAVRDLYETREGFLRAWWRQAADLGWTSLLVPDRLGGGTLSGRPVADAVIVAEEMGRLVAPGPFLPVNVVAATLATDGTGEQQSSLLPGLLSGEMIATWAFCEQHGRWDTAELATTASASGGDILLDGAKAYVEALASAEHLLVSARTGTGFTQVLVPLDTPGVHITPGRSIDMTRRFGSVRFDSVRLPGNAVVGEVGGAADRIAHQLQLAIALQCAELVGVADRTLEFTIEYGRDRVAFDRPIVSFQALKHRLADIAVRLEGSKAVTDELAAAIDDGAADADWLASVTKAYVGTYAPDIVDDCVQITGGIGVTWEHDIHLYNRRATVGRAVFGTPEEHKQHLLRQLSTTGATA